MPFTVSDFKRPMSARTWAAWLAVGGAVVLGGCVAVPDGGYENYAYTSTVIYSDYDYPPPARVEYRTIAPSPYHVWVGGDWFWGSGRYDWRPGYWAGPGYRPMPPPHRPHVRPPRPPQAGHGPGHRPPPGRPDHPQRPPHANQGQRPPPDQGRPHAPQRPPSEQVRPQRPPSEQARPQRPSRGDGDHRRPSHGRDRGDGRR